MNKIFIALIEFYRKYLSPLKRKSSCRFVPTCSQYALEAFRKYPFFKAFGLSAWRILRCNPFCRGGIDRLP